MPRVTAYIDDMLPMDVYAQGEEVVFFWDGPDGDGQGGVEMRLDMDNAARLARAILRWTKEADERE